MIYAVWALLLLTWPDCYRCFCSLFIIISSIVYLYRIDSVLSLMPSIGIQIESHILIMAACVSIKHGHCAICYIDAWKVKLVIELENQR